MRGTQGNNSILQLECLQFVFNPATVAGVQVDTLAVSWLPGALLMPYATDYNNASACVWQRNVEPAWTLLVASFFCSQCNVIADTR
jgi:hypothetical protein